MTKIKIHKGSAGINAGPLYEKTYEDHVGTAYNYFLAVQGVDGNDYTYHRPFSDDDDNGWLSVAEGEKAAQVINELGEINLKFWNAGTPWDAYKIPQTYEEEKRDALEREYGI